MQNLMLETELVQLEERGIALEHIRTIKKDEVVDLELFENDIRREAKKMADLYVLYYALENSIRRLISGRLSEKHGAAWWETVVPDGVKNSVADKQKKKKTLKCQFDLKTHFVTQILGN